jgi:hypothetical protein
MEFCLSGTRHRDLKREVESLRELRLIAGKTQADVATALQIRQPSVSKMEKQGDMYLSTLRAYVEAIGGELELRVKLPNRPVLRLCPPGDARGRMSRSRRQNAHRRRRSSAASQRLQSPIRDRNHRG